VSNTEEFIVPVEQAIVLFFGEPVIAVRLPDGRIGAVINTMCSILKMDAASQIRRLREDETTTESLVQVQIRTETRGLQIMGALIAWAIPYWLGGIQLSRIKDDQKREAIAYFKKEAANVLYAHFSQKALALSGPTQAIVPAEPIQPAQDANALAWAEYHRQMAAFYQWKAATDMRIDTLETQYQSVEERLESYKPVLDLVPEILERLGPQTLTDEHQQAIREYARQLHELTGKPYPTIWEDLKTAFRVAKYANIPELDWPRVVKWFQAQLEQKRKR
jgi:antirepressor protein